MGHSTPSEITVDLENTVRGHLKLQQCIFEKHGNNEHNVPQVHSVSSIQIPLSIHLELTLTELETGCTYYIGPF